MVHLWFFCATPTCLKCCRLHLTLLMSHHAPQSCNKFYKAKTASLVNLRQQSLAHILFNLPSSCCINLREKKKKKNATIYSCLPPLLLHWSSGSLSDLLKGTDQNNCSVPENMTHSSPCTVWWLQSNSGFFFFFSND